MRGAQPVQDGAGLTAELDDVGEPLGRDEHRARDALLEQCVRRHGHAVRERGHVARPGAGAEEDLLDRGEDAGGLVGGRRRRLGRDDGAAGDQDGVGEGAADVHPQEHGGGR
jgi:hypothetical protein